MLRQNQNVNRAPKPSITLMVIAAVVSCGVHAFAAPITPDNATVVAEVARVSVGFYPGDVSFLSDTRLLIAGNTSAVIWDLTARGQAKPQQVPNAGQVIAVSEDLSTLVLCTNAGAVALWSWDPLQKLRNVCAVQGTSFPRAAFSPDGRLLAVSNHRTEIELWNPEKATLAATLTGHASNLFGFAFSPDGQILATAGGKSGGSPTTSCIKIWDVATGTLSADLATADIGDNHAIAFVAQGARLLSAGNHRLVVWETATWTRVYETSPSYPCTYGLSVSPDQRLLALAMESQRVRLVDLTTMRALRDLTGPRESMDAAFSPDGTRLAASFTDGTVIVWATP
jgi:WD40 repeat protein